MSLIYVITNSLTLFHTGICTTFKKMPCCERDQWQNWKITWTALENPEATSFHHSAGLPVRTYDACLPKCPGHPHPGRAGPKLSPAWEHLCLPWEPWKDSWRLIPVISWIKYIVRCHLCWSKLNSTMKNSSRTVERKNHLARIQAESCQ